MARVVDRFIRWGAQWFSQDAWHRVPFQPILYLMLWGAVLRIVIINRDSPMNFDSVISPSASTAWTALGLGCPPLAALAWWLIKRCKWHKSALAGLWIRLGADVGQLVALVSYHIVVVFTMPAVGTEARVYARYAVGACIMFVGVLVLRDIWSLVLTERVAGRMRGMDE